MLLGCAASLWALVQQRETRCLWPLGTDRGLASHPRFYPLGAYPSAYGLYVYEHAGGGAEGVRKRTAMVRAPNRESWDELRTS
jgi:hypothetical protein